MYAFCWRFESRYRGILPDYEEEPAMESGLLTVKSSCDIQQGKQAMMEKVEEGKNSVSSIAEQMEGKNSVSSIAEPMEGGE